MGDTVARVLGGLALVGIASNLVLTCRVERKLAETAGRPAVTAALDRGSAPQALTARRAAKASRSAGEAPEARPADEGGRRERREKFEGAWREAAIGEIEAFGEEMAVEPATLEQVLDEILSMTDATGEVREEIRGGAIAPAEGREEIRALKDASDLRLDELLGATNADALRERLREGRPF
ncbi:MAG: hypothetical protein ABMA64_08630 [Myxococcota bacterium]